MEENRIENPNFKVGDIVLTRRTGQLLLIFLKEGNMTGTFKNYYCYNFFAEQSYWGNFYYREFSYMSEGVWSY